MMLNSTPSTNKVQNLLMLSPLKKKEWVTPEFKQIPKRVSSFYEKLFPTERGKEKLSPFKYFCNRRLNERTNTIVLNLASDLKPNNS